MRRVEAKWPQKGKFRLEAKNSFFASGPYLPYLPLPCSLPRSPHRDISKSPGRAATLTLLAFNGSYIRPGWSSCVDQVASWRKSQKVPEVDTSVRVTGDGWREADEIGRAHDQPFGVDAHAVFPPAVGASDVCAGGMVAVGPLEGEVVGENVRAGVEFDVFFTVAPRGVVGHRDAPRIGVEGDAVLFISEGDRAPDDVIDRNTIATQFETVAVARRGRAAARQVPVVVRDAILDGHGADRARISLREEVPAIVNVV